MRSRSPRLPAALLFLATISAALPIVRFCPLTWDEIDLATYATCSAMPATGECRTPAHTAATPAASGCGAMASCPMRGHMRDAATKCGACEAPAASSTTNRGPQPAAPRVPKHHDGPGWCFAEPLIAAATRAHAPTPPAPLAIAALIVGLDVPATARLLVPDTDTRPPTPPPLARPTIRGPPLLLG